MTAQERAKRIKLAIILMAWPAVSILLTILLYVLVYITLGQREGFDTSPLGEIINIIIALVGPVSMLVGLPSFIIGLILLVLALSPGGRDRRTVDSSPVAAAVSTALPVRTDGMAIAGMVLGIVGFFTAMFGIGFIVGVVGLCLSAVALKRAQGRGFAIAGLITSICAIAASLLVIMVVILAAYNNIQSDRGTNQDGIQSPYNDNPVNSL